MPRVPGRGAWRMLLADCRRRAVGGGRRTGRRPLNSIYITIGVTLIAVLLAALVGPFLVDWTAYRSTFERYGEEVLGHRVAVMGQAELQLLPTPTLTFTDVRVGEPEDALVVVSRFSMRVDLPPLLKGEIRVVEMTLDQPSLRLSVDEQGRLDWLAERRVAGLLGGLDPDGIMFEQVNIQDGRLVVTDARSGRRHEVDDIDATLAARSLLGPYRIDGMASAGGERATVTVATGRRDADGSIRVRAGLTPVSLPVDLVAVGRMTVADGRPAYEGRFTLASITPDEDRDTAWRSEGGFALDVAGLDLVEARFSYGPEDRPVTLEGSLAIDLADPLRFQLDATAKQLDLDRIAGRGPQDPLSATDAGSVVLAALSGLPHPAIPGTVRLAIPAVVTGGNLVQDVQLEAERLASGWRVARMAARLPGRTEFLARGDLELAPHPAFRGSFAASVAQPNQFADWWRRGRAPARSVSPFAVEARVVATPTELALTEMAFEIAGAPGRGTLSHTRSQPARLAFDIDADTLDADQALLLADLFFGRDADRSAGTDAGQLAGLAGDAEISARLFAKTVTVGALEARNATVRLGYRDDVLTLEAVEIEDLAGARIEAQGRVAALSTAPTGSLTALVDAQRLDGVSALAGRLLPGSTLAQVLEQRAALLAPARLQLEFEGEADGAGTRASLQARGDIGGTVVDLSGGLGGRLDDWRRAALDVTGSLSAADGARLLGQAGLPVLPFVSLGDGRVEFSAAGRPDEALEGSLRLYLGTANAASAAGEVRLAAGMPAAYSADLVLRLQDASLVGALAGRAPVIAGETGAIDVAATLQGTGDTFSLSALEGVVAGSRVAGDLEVDLRLATGDLPPRIRGRVEIDALDLASLSDLVLATDPLAPAGAGGWSAAPFGPPQVPPADIALDIAALRLGIGTLPPLTGVTGRLGVSPEALSLDVAEAGIAGGRVTGTWALRRAEGQASLTATARIEGAALEEFVWTRNGRAVATGTMDLGLDFEGAGRSVAAIVSGLSGGATLQVRSGEIRGLNPAAFGLVIRAVDAGLDLGEDAVRDAFAGHLDAGVLGFTTLEASGSIAGGVLRVNSLRVDTPSANVFGGAQVDLARRTLNSELSLKVDPGEEAVRGAEPQVALVFAGPLEAPSRQIDVAPFTGYLTLRAFEQEVRRVEDLQAEITERDRLGRELRRQREVERRREREREEQQLERERQLRLDEEDQARREAEARAEAERAAAAAREEAERAQREREAAAREAAEAEARRQRAVAPEPAPPAVLPEGQVSPAEAFGDRIRRALETLDQTGAPGPTGSASPSDTPGQPLQLLPPLDPPVFIGTTPDR